MAFPARFAISRRAFSSLRTVRAPNSAGPNNSNEAMRAQQTGRDGPPATQPSAADDPYPLPLQHKQHPLSSDTSPDSYLAHPLDGYNGVPREPEPDLKTQRARLVYQTRKRGTLETGLLISTFATPQRLEQMGRAELTELDRLLKVPEWTLYYWGIGKAEPPQDSEFKDSQLLRTSRSAQSWSAFVLGLTPSCLCLPPIHRRLSGALQESHRRNQGHARLVQIEDGFAEARSSSRVR